MVIYDNIFQFTYDNNAVVFNIGRDGVAREVISTDKICRLMDPNKYINTGLNLEYIFQDEDSYSDVIERRVLNQSLHGNMTSVYEVRTRPRVNKKTGE